MPRLFTGLEIPSDVAFELDLLRGGIGGARWIDRENFHITLRFIGDVNEDVADDIHDALRFIRTRRFDLTLAGVGHFESAGQVHTLWAGVEKNPDLLALRDRIESALVRMGLPPEGRRFLPHVTLCRLRDASVARVSGFLAANNLFRAGPIPVAHFTLFSSYLQHSGAIYTPEAEYFLQAAPETRGLTA